MGSCIVSSERMMHPQPPQATKSNQTLKTVFIVLGVLFLLGMTTCIGTCMYAKGKVSEFAASIGDGGLTLSSPEAVRDALAGPKKDYVGQWVNPKGTKFEIDADGSFKFEKSEGSTSTTNAPIAAFSGNDIVIKVFVTVTFKVSTPPHRVGDHMEMVMDGLIFTRK
jgi:hypothetical protein